MMCHHEKKHYSQGSSGIFLFGILAGALAGLLLAPKSGKETRKDVADFAQTASQEIKKGAKEIKKSCISCCDNIKKKKGFEKDRSA